MFKERRRVRELEHCNKRMFGDLVLTFPGSPLTIMPKTIVRPIPIMVRPRRSAEDVLLLRNKNIENEKRRASALVDELLLDIYSVAHTSTDYNSTTSGRSHRYFRIDTNELYKKDFEVVSSIVSYLSNQIERAGIKLVRRLKRRDALRRQQEAHCDVITSQLGKLACQSDMRFTIQPVPGDSGFSQWAAAMKMVAQLPSGIPPEFRSRLWLTLADRHLVAKGVDWPRVERTCFSEWSHPEDAELGVQIVKDLHRTGCSLFCGEDGQENQALLKRVLLAYARWNKAVGYCQGFNMLAALILQVTDKSESDALKLMIYLIEGVLPDSYFADSLRGLSVDMAVFRELLRSRLPRLSRHLDLLQNAAKEGTTSYEPPLTNVFTMQWFLTLFCNCLPQPSVLRVWDLILLEGNEILLRTALAIWQTLADRILSVRSADEFYCIMGVLTRDLLEFNLIDANSLIKAVVSIGALTELKNLREHYLYNINPWGSIPTTYGVAENQLKIYPRERLALDISALKKQYTKLRQRQRQAHIIFTAAISRQPPTTPVAMNHLLLGKSALVPAKRIGPPKGIIPPVRVPASTLHWKDTPKPQSSSSSSSDTELCDEGEESDSSVESKKVPIKTSQFVHEDNPVVNSDNLNLMKLDNTEPEAVEATEISSGIGTLDDVELSQKFSDSLDNQKNEDNDISKASTSESDYKFKTFEYDSEDDSVEFERFLEDRVQCLKNSDVSEEFQEKETSRVNLARRNSERALQIIQENSLILHRILQCQSRLTPSPPTVETDAKTIAIQPGGNSYWEAETPTNEGMNINAINLRYSDVNVDDENSDFDPKTVCSGLYTYPYNNTLDSPSDSPPLILRDLNNMQATNSSDCETGLISPHYSSKYSEILAKSKNLDERYNNLILNPTIKSKLQEVVIDNMDNPKTDETEIDFDSRYVASKDQGEKVTVEDKGATYSYQLEFNTRTKLNSYLEKKPLNVEDASTSYAERIFDFTHPDSSDDLQDPIDRSNLEHKYSWLGDANTATSQDELVRSPEKSNYSPTRHKITSPGAQTRLKSPLGNEQPLKSPSKVFNPFPIPLSSRQNKDVAVKLGLYKK